MVTRRGASISLKMIFTSIGLVSAIVACTSLISAVSARRVFEETNQRLAEAHTTALQQRGRVQIHTMVESARNAILVNDSTTLRSIIPAAAHIDSDVLAIYVVLDNGLIIAHSDARYNEKPLQEVDPVNSQKVLSLTAPVAEVVEAPTRRFLFANPLLAMGKKQGALVVLYSLRSLEADLLRIEQEKQALTQAYTLRAGLLGLVFAFLGAAVAIFQGLRIARPLKLLAWRADQIARGDLQTRVEVSTASKQDEIGLLAQNFNYMADQLQVLLRETEQKGALEKELEVARTIQEALVPSGDVIDGGGVRVAGHFQPATQCGGDWWTAHELPGERVLVVIGDVTGHGVPSAMITAAAKAACDVVRAFDGADLRPGRLLSIMNRAIFEAAGRKLVMTCFAAILDARRGTVSYANAGHNFPYLYRRREVSVEGGRVEGDFQVLMARGNRLGDVPDSTYDEAAHDLRSGDLLVFYTDGIIECESPAGEEFGEKRFRQAIRGAAPLELAALRGAVVGAASAFYGDRPRKDDITLVLACVR